MKGMYAAIAEHAAARPSAPAVIDSEVALRYAELVQAIDGARAWLAGARPQVLGLALADSLAWVVLDLAALMEGIPVVPLPPFFSTTQKRHALRDAGVDRLATDDNAGTFADLPWPERVSCTITMVGTTVTLRSLEAMPAGLPEGTAKVTYTSGTTGAPKGVCLNADAMESVATSLVRTCALGPGDRHFAALPLATLLENIGGVYAPLIAGACTRIGPIDGRLGPAGAREFDASALLRTLDRNAATTVILVPQMLTALVDALEGGAPTPERLRFVAVGGATVSARLLERAAARGLPVYEGYGLSECGSVVALNTSASNRRGSVGRVLPHAAVRIADDGEILVSGATLLGYAGSQTITSHEWPTGDCGWLDAEGYLHISGRKRDVLITAFGRNVAPEWVESELVAQPAIAQAAVFGEARPWLTAVVVPRTRGDSGVARAVAAANAALPDYARVRAWIEADEHFTTANGLATANGRVRRDAIRARYEGRLSLLYQEGGQMNCYDELFTATAHERATLLSIPFIRDGAAGRLRLHDYIAFLSQAYHHVKHTLPLLMACAARLPERLEWLRQALVEYVTEEVGHQEWILDDLRACGADAEAVRNGHPDLPAELMVAYAYDTIARGNPVGFLGMVLVLEGTSVEVASRAAEALERSLALPKAAFTYLTSHGSLDQEHTKFYESLVNRLEDAGDRSAVIRCARRFYRLYGDIFRALDAARQPLEVAA
jgi:long-subunit acyl-CoA synthetase (AMP-forming)/pyrroloquinoline quinone (PQQ) biosynthesis protein C